MSNRKTDPQKRSSILGYFGVAILAFYLFFMVVGIISDRNSATHLGAAPNSQGLSQLSENDGMGSIREYGEVPDSYSLPPGYGEVPDSYSLPPGYGEVPDSYSPPPGYGYPNAAGYPKNQWVNPYTRDDGTHVDGYWRNSPTDEYDTCQVIDC